MGGGGEKDEGRWRAAGEARLGGWSRSAEEGGSVSVGERWGSGLADESGARDVNHNLFP